MSSQRGSAHKPRPLQNGVERLAAVFRESKLIAKDQPLGATLTDGQSRILMTIASKSVRRSYYYYYYPYYYYYYYKEKERKVNFRTRFFLMLANEFLAFEHSPLFFVDIIIHCSLLRTCRVRVEEKEEFLVYTVLWTLTCHPYLESATAL